MKSRVPPTGLKFYTVRILARNFRRAWGFYEKTLGLSPVPGHGEPPYGEFAWNGVARVGLFERGLMASAVGLRSGGRAAGSVGGSALILETRDVDAFARRLKQRGVRLLRPPTDRPEWRLRTLHLRDPDGYVVEVCSPLPMLRKSVSARRRRK